MKWVVMRSTSEYLHHQLHRKKDYNVSITREERERGETFNTHILCKRPKRHACHTWSYESECFLYDGCNKRVNVMSMEADDNTGALFLSFFLFFLSFPILFFVLCFLKFYSLNFNKIIQI